VVARGKLRDTDGVGRRTDHSSTRATRRSNRRFTTVGGVRGDHYLLLTAPK